MSFLRGVMKKSAKDDHQSTSNKENGQQHGEDDLWSTPGTQIPAPSNHNNNLATSKQNGTGSSHANGTSSKEAGSAGVTTTRSSAPPPAVPAQRPKLQFHCQLAHGSPTGVLTGFSNVKELYQMIAGCYNIPVTDVSEHQLTTVPLPQFH